MEETVQTFLVAVLTGLVYVGVRVGAFQISPFPAAVSDVEKGLWKGIPVEALRNVQVVVGSSAEEESKEDLPEEEDRGAIEVVVQTMA